MSCLSGLPYWPLALPPCLQGASNSRLHFKRCLWFLTALTQIWSFLFRVLFHLEFTSVYSLSPDGETVVPALCMEQSTVELLIRNASTHRAIPPQSCVCFWTLIVVNWFSLSFASCIVLFKMCSLLWQLLGQICGCTKETGFYCSSTWPLWWTDRVHQMSC